MQKSDCGLTHSCLSKTLWWTGQNCLHDLMLTNRWYKLEVIRAFTFLLISSDKINSTFFFPLIAWKLLNKMHMATPLWCYNWNSQELKNCFKYKHKVWYMSSVGPPKSKSELKKTVPDWLRGHLLLQYQYLVSRFTFCSLNHTIWWSELLVRSCIPKIAHVDH